jgi:hypothetical protein
MANSCDVVGNAMEEYEMVLCLYTLGGIQDGYTANGMCGNNGRIARRSGPILAHKAKNDENG